MSDAVVLVLLFMVLKSGDLGEYIYIAYIKKNYISVSKIYGKFKKPTHIKRDNKGLT